MGRGEEAERPVFRGGVVETGDQCVGRGLDSIVSLHLAYIIASCMYIESAMSICVVSEHSFPGVSQPLYTTKSCDLATLLNRFGFSGSRNGLYIHNTHHRPSLSRLSTRCSSLFCSLILRRTCKYSQHGHHVACFDSSLPHFFQNFLQSSSSTTPPGSRTPPEFARVDPGSPSCQWPPVTRSPPWGNNRVSGGSDANIGTTPSTAPLAASPQIPIYTPVSMC